MYEPSMGPAVLAGNDNILFSQHNYAGYTDPASEGAYLDAMHAAHLAVIIGEFGYGFDGVSSSAAGWTTDHAAALANFTAAPPRGVGLLWWHGTMGDGYSLKDDGNAFYADGGPEANLSDGGKRLWALGH